MRISEDGTGSRRPLLGDVGMSPYLDSRKKLTTANSCGFYILYNTIQNQSVYTFLTPAKEALYIITFFRVYSEKVLF